MLPDVRAADRILIMIRRCTNTEFDRIYAIINDAAVAYKGVVPADCYVEPYMDTDELRHEIESGVAFWGCEENGALVGVMGIQHIKDVTLIRHAYVVTACRRQGIGASLLSRLRELANRPMLIGTWADAHWAIRFYEKNGFSMVARSEAIRLLKSYWAVPQRQMEVSVVLADARWHGLNGRG